MPPHTGHGTGHPDPRRRSTQAQHRGSHRGPARGPQLIRAGGLLFAVALLLAAVGALIIWTADSETSEPGEYRADRVKDLCDAVDAEELKKLTGKEAERDNDADKNQNPVTFTCELRFTGPEDSADYDALTLSVDARIADTIGNAEKAFAGVVDYEKSRGFAVNDRAETGDEAVVVPKANSDPQECRVHIRDSNAVLSTKLTVSGSALSCDDEGVDLLTKTGTSTLDVMRSE